METKTPDGQAAAAPQPDAAEPATAASPAARIHGLCDELFAELSSYVTAQAMQATAKKMGIWRHGHVCLHAAEHQAHLQSFHEYCLIDVEKNGTTALGRFRAMTRPDADSERGRLLHALDNAPLSLYQMVARPDPASAVLRDLGDGRETTVVEPGIWNELDGDEVIMARVLTLNDITSTTGRLLVLPIDGDGELPSLPPAKSRKQLRERAVAILRPLLTAAAEEAHAHEGHDHSGHDHDHHGHNHG